MLGVLIPFGAIQAVDTSYANLPAPFIVPNFSKPITGALTLPDV